MTEVNKPAAPLRITVSPSRVISQSEGRHWFPGSFYRVSDGGLLLWYSVCEDELPGNIAHGIPHALLKSFDNGHNWFCQAVVRGWLYNEALPYGQLADGRMLGMLGGVFQDEAGTPYSMTYTSTDGARTWDGPRKTPIIFPPPIMLGDPVVGIGRTMASIGFEGNMIEQRDGILLRIADGKFAGDTYTRVGVMQSTDKGGSWSWLATIADATTAPLNFNESFLLEVADNELICIMRSDPDICSASNMMYQSRSLDGGRTWNKPVSLGHNGVTPKLVKLQNGVIACCYGRLKGVPTSGVQVMFSLDKGATWVQHTTIYEHASTGYATMLEIRPNELLLVHDILGYAWSHVNSINSVTITVALETSTR